MIKYRVIGTHLFKVSKLITESEEINEAVFLVINTFKTYFLHTSAYLLCKSFYLFPRETDIGL